MDNFNKKARCEENDTSVSDILNAYPYIHRGIQASAWMKRNSLIFHPELNKDETISLCYSYIFDLFKRFYSECGLSYNPEIQEVSDGCMEILIETPINETEMDVHFSLFLSFLQDNIKNAFYVAVRDWYNISCVPEGNCLWIKIDLNIDEHSNIICYDKDKKRTYTKNPDNILI